VTALILCIVSIGPILDHILPKNTPQYLSFVIIIVSMVGFVYLLYKYTDWIPTYLYVRLSLGIKVSPSEAAQLTFLFSGDYWYPLSEIKTLKPEERKKALFNFANNIRINKANREKK
jgi:hypothetical protein